jgi:hypothetical protein
MSHIVVTSDGRWQIGWLTHAGDDNRGDLIALDWYHPPLREGVPIVPVAIIDYIAGCIIMLRGGLVLPAAAVLSIALEAVLWSALALKGISRLGTDIKYRAVEWELVKRSAVLLVKVTGAAKGLDSLGKVTENYPPTFTFDVRRMQSGEGQQQVVLQAKVDAELVDFLTSDEEERQGEKAQHGLSVALERSRSEQVDVVKGIPAEMDKMLVPLRNNVIHLALDGDLYEPIPVIGNEITTLDQLRESEVWIRTLLPWIMEIINSVYAEQIEKRYGSPNDEVESKSVEQ